MFLWLMGWSMVNNVKGMDVHLYTIPFVALGMDCVLEFFADTPEHADAVSARLIDEVRRVDEKYSRYREHSFLSLINRAAAAGASITLDDETANLIDYAFECYRMSDGLFDISSGVLRKAWDARTGMLPARDKMDALLATIGLDKIIWERPVLHFPVPGMELDFGGICKEYAADLAADLYTEMGIEHGHVDLGGDESIMGARPDGQPWVIDIIDEHLPVDADVKVHIMRGGLACSGDIYKIADDGKKYGHILNPRTACSVDGLSFVAVFSRHCMTAGSFSTIAMLKGRDGPAWLDSYGLRYLSIDADGNIINTLGGVLSA
jgi:FAD:protein FMN transferase